VADVRCGCLCSAVVCRLALVLLRCADCLADVCSCAHCYWCHCTRVLLLLESPYILTFIIIIIIIIVVVVDSITLLSIYLLGNLQLT
jgi:hypothetical protein